MGYIFDALNQIGDKKPEDETTPQASDVLVDPPENDGQIFSAISEDEADCSQENNEVEPTTQQPASAEADGTLSSKHITIDVSKQWLDSVDDRLIALREPSTVMAEEYRSIRTSLLARWNHERHLVHTITSATPQEGKTITSINLGLTFAELHNRSVIVIEADLRLPTFEKLLHLQANTGLVEYLRGQCNLSKIIHQIGENGLHVIPAGSRANNDSVTMLSSQRMTNLVKELRTRYDHVIIDTPPVVELADAGILGSISDDVLLIARMNRTPKSLIEQAKRTLTSYNAPVSGMIATDQRHVRRKHYYYRYGYRYNYHNRYYTKQAA